MPRLCVAAAAVIINGEAYTCRRVQHEVRDMPLAKLLAIAAMLSGDEKQNPANCASNRCLTDLLPPSHVKA